MAAGGISDFSLNIEYLREDSHLSPSEKTELIERVTERVLSLRDSSDIKGEINAIFDQFALPERVAAIDIACDGIEKALSATPIAHAIKDAYIIGLKTFCQKTGSEKALARAYFESKTLPSERVQEALISIFDTYLTLDSFSALESAFEILKELPLDSAEDHIIPLIKALERYVSLSSTPCRDTKKFIIQIKQFFYSLLEASSREHEGVENPIELAGIALRENILYKEVTSTMVLSLIQLFLKTEDLSIIPECISIQSKDVNRSGIRGGVLREVFLNIESSNLSENLLMGLLECFFHPSFQKERFWIEKELLDWSSIKVSSIRVDSPCYRKIRKCALSIENYPHKRAQKARLIYALWKKEHSEELLEVFQYTINFPHLMSEFQKDLLTRMIGLYAISRSEDLLTRIEAQISISGNRLLEIELWNVLLIITQDSRYFEEIQARSFDLPPSIWSGVHEEVLQFLIEIIRFSGDRALYQKMLEMVETHPNLEQRELFREIIERTTFPR